MKPSAFADLLLAHAELMRAAGDPRSGDGLTALAEGFRAVTAASVKTALKRVASAEPSESAEAEPALGGALLGLRAVVAAAGAKPAAADLDALISAWGAARLSPEAFVAALRAPARTPAATPKGAAADPAKVSDYAGRLSAAVSTPEAFAALLAEIEADPAIKKPQLKTIAERTLGYPLARVSVADMLGRLRDLPRLDAYQRSKRAVIDRIQV